MTRDDTPMTNPEPRSIVSEPTPETAHEGRAALFLFVGCVLLSLASLMAFVIGVQKSEARYFDPVSKITGVNYAMLADAKKVLLKACADVVSIGDSTGLSLDPKTIQSRTGKTFLNLNLYGHTGFDGYLAQLRYLKRLGCAPQKIFVYVTPRVVMNDAAKLQGTFECFYTLLNMASAMDAVAYLVRHIDQFPLYFRYSMKTFIRYVIADNLKEGETSFLQKVVQKSAKVLSIKTDEKTIAERRLNDLVDAKGFIQLKGGKENQGPECPVTQPEYDDKRLDVFFDFRNSLYKIYPKETYVVMSSALPECTKNFDRLMAQMGKAYDVEPVKASNAFFIDEDHVSPDGSTFISLAVAKIVRP